MGDLAVFARDQLVKQIERADLTFPDLNVINEKIMPVVSPDGYEWEAEVEVVQFSSVGIAVVLADKANDGGRVGVVASRQRFPIRTISDFTEVSYETLQQSEAKGVDLQGRYGKALIDGINKKNNAIAFNGEPNYGLQGVLTLGLPRATSPTTFAAATTPEALLGLLNAPFTSIASATNTLGATTKVITLPTAQHQLIGNTFFGAAAPGMTVKQAFVNAQTSLGVTVEFVEDNSLRGKGTNGTDLMLITPKVAGLGPDSFDHPIFYYLPMEFDLPDEFGQWVDTVYRERAIARTGGVICQDPLQVLLVEGI